MSKPENPWAFPSGEFGGAEHDKHPLHDGMTLRDYFAGQALASLAAHHIQSAANVGEEPVAAVRSLAQTVYAVADAMLRARS